MYTETVAQKNGKKSIIITLTKKEILGISSKKIDVDLKDVVNIVVVYPACKRLISRYYLTKKFAYDLMEEYVKILKIPNDVSSTTKIINDVEWEIYALCKLKDDEGTVILTRVLELIRK